MGGPWMGAISMLRGVKPVTARSAQALWLSVANKKLRLRSQLLKKR
jgi:hypothetical protein